ncbi:MAG: hypothetical protein Q8M15_10510 [Bacteroidota bacterium]|nr:hypothetical protein [Bacteroidota bacterium]
MAHKKTCPVCLEEFWGNLNKIFCGDSCRKYEKRNPGLTKSGASIASNLPIAGTPVPPLSGKGRTNTGSIGSYIIKKGIDVVAHKLMHGTDLSIKSVLQSTNDDAPLKVQNLMMSASLSAKEIGVNLIKLPELWFKLLGELTSPFKMLVWGEPGQGKSTFCLQLASLLAELKKVIFISGEEKPSGKTFNEKVIRCVAFDRQWKIQVVDRLPSVKQWDTLITPNGALLPVYHCVFYDSISVLGISPMYPAELEKQSRAKVFNSILSHIFITHSQKDGKTYKGDSGWGHEVDIIIQIKNGEAIIEKNRFATFNAGQIGATFKIF